MKNLKPALAIALVFQFTSSFSQSTELKPEKINNKKTAHTYLDVMINVAVTNINYGALNSTLTGYKKPTGGIQAGVSFQAGITPAFSIVSEFYYMRKGGKLMANNPLTIEESSFRLNTLELPVLARFHFGKFYLNAGPSIAYNLSGKMKINDQSTKLSFENSNEGFRRYDAGIQMGGGVAFAMKQKRIALDIRYAHGLTNIAHGSEMYNRGIMISVFVSKAWKTNPLGKK